MLVDLPRIFAIFRAEMPFRFIYVGHSEHILFLKWFWTFFSALLKQHRGKCLTEFAKQTFFFFLKLCLLAGPLSLLLCHLWVRTLKNCFLGWCCTKQPPSLLTSLKSQGSVGDFPSCPGVGPWWLLDVFLSLPRQFCLHSRAVVPCLCIQGSGRHWKRADARLGLLAPHFFP